MLHRGKLALQRCWTTARRFSARRADIASLAAFRILLGFVLAGSAARFMATGWIVQYLCLFVAALGVAAGCCYRRSALAFFVGFTLVELSRQSLYSNHHYLVSLLAALLCALPAGRAWSIDVWRRPALALERIPLWVLVALRLQVALVGLQVLTRALVPIGAFPWLMTATTTLLLPANWPHRCTARLARLVGPRRLLPTREERQVVPSGWSPPRWLLPALALHSVAQVALPLRQPSRSGTAAPSATAPAEAQPR